MLLVLGLLFLAGLVLTADCPSSPGGDCRPAAVSHAPVVKPANSTPSEPARPVPDRPRAHVEPTEDPAACQGGAVHEPVGPPVPRDPRRGSPFAPNSAPEPLIYTFCTLLI
jgi:hypothetical protein